ncbi:MAG TPA: CDP-alcohol phosphatidyltransferase family protein [Acidimicrobiia bacterium]|jgi:cardiolipin synthase
MTAPGIARDRGVWTIPNAISLARLAGVPVFLWLLLGEDRPVAAGILFAVLGATDWVDGYIARHFDQGSEVGKILDPVSDRVMLIAGAIGLLLSGDVPLWVGVLVLAREAALSVVTLILAAAGARRIDVQWVGKAGTLALMFALPGFVLVSALDAGALRDVIEVVTWLFTIGGLVLSYYAAARYVPMARAALADGRAAREVSAP